MNIYIYTKYINVVCLLESRYLKCVLEVGDKQITPTLENVKMLVNGDIYE